MTNKEATKHIKSAAKLAIDAGYSSDIVDACALAVRALEQESKTDKALPWESGKIIVPLPKPKTVLYSGDGYADGYMVYDMAECPNCGYEYEDGDKDWGENFCPHCGQPLKWESEGKE